jgi:hypothetical protein
VSYALASVYVFAIQREFGGQSGNPSRPGSSCRLGTVKQRGAIFDNRRNDRLTQRPKNEMFVLFRSHEEESHKWPRSVFEAQLPVISVPVLRMTVRKCSMGPKEKRRRMTSRRRRGTGRHHKQISRDSHCIAKRSGKKWTCVTGSFIVCHVAKTGST